MRGLKNNIVEKHLRRPASLLSFAFVLSFVAKLNQFCRRKPASLLSFAVLQGKLRVFIAKLN
jgi:hypothetical protein